MNTDSKLYVGEVSHQRFKGNPHALHYRVFALLVNLDELPRLNQTLRWFSHNRFNLLSLHDKDFGLEEKQPLRNYVESLLDTTNVGFDGGAIQLLAYPRVLGYVFNPLSVYYCHNQDGSLAAVLYEVTNTFKQRHTYVMPVKAPAPRVTLYRCPKKFYVSPFVSMDSHYHFRIEVPAKILSLDVNEEDQDGPVLFARFKAQQRPLNDSELIKVWANHPLMTLKVIAGIHWEALKLFSKGVPLVERPEPPLQAHTVVQPLAT